MTTQQIGILQKVRTVTGTFATWTWSHCLWLTNFYYSVTILSYSTRAKWVWPFPELITQMTTAVKEAVQCVEVISDDPTEQPPLKKFASFLPLQYLHSFFHLQCLMNQSLTTSVIYMNMQNCFIELLFVTLWTQFSELHRFLTLTCRPFPNSPQVCDESSMRNDTTLIHHLHPAFRQVFVCISTPAHGDCFYLAVSLVLFGNVKFMELVR